MKYFVIVILLIVYCCPGSTQDTYAEKGYDELINKNYEQAITYFQTFLQEEKPSVQLYYNLGNAYLGLDSLGKAVLYYERALVMESDNADISKNLEIAKSRIEDPLTTLDDFFLIKYWNTLTGFFSPNTWASISVLLALLILGLAYIVWYKSIHIRKRWLIIMVGILIVLLLMALLAGNQGKARITVSNRGVILHETYLKSGPDDRSNDLKQLYPGYTIDLLDAVEGWYKIRTADREEGWVLPDAFEKI